MGKKKKSILPEEFEPAFAMGGIAIGSSMLGSGFDFMLPAGVSNPLTTIGSTTSTFVAPVATIGVAGFTMKQLKKLEKKF